MRLCALGASRDQCHVICAQSMVRPQMLLARMLFLKLCMGEAPPEVISKDRAVGHVRARGRTQLSRGRRVDVRRVSCGPVDRRCRRRCRQRSGHMISNSRRWTRSVLRLTVWRRQSDPARAPRICTFSRICRCAPARNACARSGVGSPPWQRARMQNARMQNAHAIFACGQDMLLGRLEGAGLRP